MRVVLVFIAALALTGSVARGEGGPVVIIPGLTSSVLEAELSEAYDARDQCTYTVPRCATDSKKFTLWLSSQQMGVRTCCMVEHMKLQRPRGDKGCAVNMDGVTISEKDFGGVDGVRVINPQDPYEYHLYDDMLKALKDVGYVYGKSVRVATYDWRMYGDVCWTPKFFGRLRKLIEETVEMNDGKRVRLVCHSLGCSVAHAFLAHHKAVTPEWKAKYISGLLATGAPFGGAGGDVIRSWVMGPVYSDWMPVVLSKYARTGTGTWPVLLSLFPQNVGGLPIWDKDYVFVSTPHFNYTTDDMEKLVRAVSAAVPDNALGAHYVDYLSHIQWSKTMPGPGVPMGCVYLTDVKTPLGITFLEDDWEKDPVAKLNSYGPGDGTVNQQSSEVPCKAWGAHLAPMALGGANHVTMLNHPLVVEHVKCYALGYDNGSCAPALETAGPSAV